MVEKSLIVEELGARALLLPDYVSRGLAANERVKYYLTLLQAAKLHADDPAASVSNLRAEREASRVDDAGFDAVVGASRITAKGYHIPRASELQTLIVDGVEEMISPLDAVDGEFDLEVRQYRDRLGALTAAAPSLRGDVVPESFIAAVTDARRERGDSVHLLVMDLHKALHRLQVSLAQETIDGARVYGIRDTDRPVIAAFMEGLNATAPLKFDHPGLGTTATCVGDQLIIENDIGATDAHVLVITIAGLEATLTYTDVHTRRAEFFESLFTSFDIKWEGRQQRATTGLPESQTYVMLLGRFAARNPEHLRRYLRFAGSRIVFLIDWNKARKRLQRFLPKPECIDVLVWAANHDYGHRAWLQLGGEQLVYDVIERVARGYVRYGQRLDEVLGRDDAVTALQRVLQITAEGLLTNRSDRLIRDEVEAELLRHFQAAQEALFSAAAAHAALVFELASGVRDGLLRPQGDALMRFRQRTAERAKFWETKADKILDGARTTSAESAATAAFGQLLQEADEAADSLEEATFLLTLLPPMSRDEPCCEPLLRLAALVLAAAHEFVKSVESAVYAHRGSIREDMQDFLEAVDAIGTIEHTADVVEREIMTVLLRDTTDSRQLHLVSTLAHVLERATDSLARSVLTLRDYVLSDARVI